MLSHLVLLSFTLVVGGFSTGAIFLNYLQHQEREMEVAGASRRAG